MKRIITLIWTAAILAGCSSPEGGGDGDTISIRATAQLPTKGGYDGTRAVWHPGDRIGVFAGENSNALFTMSGLPTNNNTNAVFVGSLPGGIPGGASYHGYYPYAAEGVTYDASNPSFPELTFPIPATQTYVEGGFSGMPMMAYYDGLGSSISFRFLNAGCAFRLSFVTDGSIEDDIAVQSIVLTDYSGSRLNGLARTTFSASWFDYPLMQSLGKENVATSLADITLDCSAAGGVVLSSDPGDPSVFYLVIPPDNYTQGFNVTLNVNYGSSQGVPLTFRAKSGGFSPSANTIYTMETKTITAADLP